jgi:hypothetical protein
MDEEAQARPRRRFVTHARSEGWSQTPQLGCFEAAAVFAVSTKESTHRQFAQ